MKNKVYLLFSILIFLVSFGLRFSIQETPFWVDEFSTAQEAKLILTHGLNVFTQNETLFETHNITTHFITAFSFMLLGIGEWQARVALMLIGSLTSVLLYLLAKKLTNNSTAIAASLLYTFSYLQITWARQARGYVLQQLLVLTTLFLYQSLIEKFSKLKLALFVVTAGFGMLTHATYLLVLIALAMHYSIFNRKHLIKVVTHPLAFLILLCIVALSGYTGQLITIATWISKLASTHPNNFSYYHSFLWREQTVTAVLALLGGLLLFVTEKNKKTALLLMLPISIYLLFVSFFFAPYVSRYLLAIFPLLYIAAGTTISQVAKLISKPQAAVWSLLISFFIIANGDTFVIKPKAFYSVNHDMREIALIDYNQVYAIIKNKADLEHGTTAIIDTWPDRMKWYLGENSGHFYTFRWLNSPGLVNGLSKSTDYVVNENQEKYIPLSGVKPIKFVGELSDLTEAMRKHPTGFIWIDDASLPEDVITYVTKNMHLELYLDHYSLDDNPYSIWPGYLYSWGFETPNPDLK